MSDDVQELQTLFEIGKSIASELDRDKILRLVAEAAVSLTGADESYLLLRRDLDDALIHCAGTHIQASWVGSGQDAGLESIARRVVEEGQPIRLARDDGSAKQLGFDLPAFALLQAPILLQHKVIGVLGVNNRRAEPFTMDAEKLLMGLADYTAIAIENARLYEETRALSRNLKLVNEVSRLVASTFDVQEIPRLLLQRTAEIIGAECGSLAWLDKRRGGVVFQLAYDGEGNELKGLRDFLMPLGQGIVGYVAQTGNPVIANDVRQHPQWSPLSDQMTGFVTTSLVAVPLIAEGEILGVVELLNKFEGDFNQSDVDLLNLVAASTATAIQNARQYAELERTNRALHEAHEQRAAAERWTVLGKAAAHLAHRINNTTAIIPITAEHTGRLLQQVELPVELRQEIDRNLDRIRRNSLYTVEMAAGLLRRFRKQPTDAHNVNSLIEKAMSLVEFPANVRVVKHLDVDLPEVDTSDLLVDAFVELFTNANQAMSPQGGILRIATFSSGGSVSIQITDNGPGIPPENLAKVFEMFFTTHDSGLGFGLWWVKTFVEQQHGEVVVESKPGEFTTFTITLPQQQPSLRSPGK